MPGRRSTILYWPWPSVVADRVFSISASLATSTVTPGITAPDVSFTTPAMALCARAAAGHKARHPSAKATTAILVRVIEPPWLLYRHINTAENSNKEMTWSGGYALRRSESTTGQRDSIYLKK